MTALQTTAMLDGALRAKEQLSLAASLSVSGNGNSVKIVNHTGHKLISGYPEGRRMWLNIKWYDGGNNLLREDGAYGPITANINGTPTQVNTLLNLDDPNTKVYEAHYGLTSEWANQLLALGYADSTPVSYDRVTGAVSYTLKNVADQAPGTTHESFHFVLNNTVVKDNRIPPYGMSYEVARVRNALPVPATQYGSPASGGAYNYYDTVALNPPSGAQYATIDLLYQPTSWEYIQFLYLANQGQNTFLAEEGNNMLEAWLNTGMAEPFAMASTTWGTPPGACEATTPTLLSATPGDKQVIASWQEIPGNPAITGYRLYYDQAGKAQLVVDKDCSAGSCNSYTDTSLTNGQQYCYKVTSYTATCESDFSTILCAIPTQPGQVQNVGVDTLQTGKWVKSGKGKAATTTFVLTNSFTQGDGVVIRATVLDEAGAPVPNATVAIDITGPESHPGLTTGPSDANGIAELTWQTQAPNKRGQGGTATGSYTATTSGVTATGYTWDGVATSVGFSVN
jgi:hypothetical protein